MRVVRLPAGEEISGASILGEWSPQEVIKWLGPIHVPAVDHEEKCFQEWM